MFIPLWPTPMPSQLADLARVQALPQTIAALRSIGAEPGVWRAIARTLPPKPLAWAALPSTLAAILVAGTRDPQLAAWALAHPEAAQRYLAPLAMPGSPLVTAV